VMLVGAAFAVLLGAYVRPVAAGAAPVDTEASEPLASAAAVPCPGR